METGSRFQPLSTLHSPRTCQQRAGIWVWLGSVIEKYKMYTVLLLVIREQSGFSLWVEWNDGAPIDFCLQGRHGVGKGRAKELMSGGGFLGELGNELLGEGND